MWLSRIFGPKVRSWRWSIAAGGQGIVMIAELGVEVLHFFHADVICNTKLEFVHGGGGWR